MKQGVVLCKESSTQSHDVFGYLSQHLILAKDSQMFNSTTCNFIIHVHQINIGKFANTHT